jgi:hypothetical protein
MVRFVKPEPFAAKPSGPYTDDDIGEEERDIVSIPYVDTLAEAHGVMFLCPKCYATNGGEVGTHHVLCWFVGKVPDDADPKPGRWNPSGTGIDDLTFVGPGAASVLLTSEEGCQWHGFVNNGDAT